MPFSINKYFILSIALIICTLVYEPYIFRSVIIVPIYLVVISACFIFLCTQAHFNLIKIIKFLSIILFFLCLLAYRMFYNDLLLIPSTFEILIIIYSILFFFVIHESKFIEKLTNIWFIFVAIISFITILASIIANFHLLPLQEIELLNYPIKYQFILGMIHSSLSLERPSFYFAEPSYLGFFLGLNFIFFTSIKDKHNRFVMIMILMAGILTGARTIWIGYLAVALLFLLFKILNMKSSIFQNSVCMIIFAVIIFFITIYPIEYSYLTEDNSLLTRQIKLYSTLSLFEETFSIPNFLFGQGATFIAHKTMQGGESNAFIKMLVEQGFIMLIFSIVAIFFMLKNYPLLLFYTMITLNAVVLLVSPLFIFNILLFHSFAGLADTHILVVQGDMMNAPSTAKHR